jgi:predicted ATPase
MAIQLATDAARSFRDGVFFVDLSAVSDVDRVLPTIAQALGLKDRGSEAAFDTVNDFFQTRRALLVLDNLEQVVASAAQLSHLLGLCSGLSLLVTSRVLLRARGEHEFYVAPLVVPDLAADAVDLRRAPAVQLFVDRAREARPGLAFDDDAIRTVAQICVRVDGLPLAIELAAARSKLLSPQGIQSRLGRRLDLLAGGLLDQPKRHHTLRTAIAWSYELLDAEARRAFGLFSVFAGGCDLDAIGAVLGRDDLRVLDLVETLVGSSLIRRFDDDQSEGRYTMLETIREFATEQLRESEGGEEETGRNAHRDFYRELAEKLTPDLTGERQSSALARLNREWENLRSALEWTARSAQPALQAALTLSLWRYWLVRGLWKEGRDWLDRALSNPEVEPALRAELLGAAGSMAQNQGDYVTARESLETALGIWRQAEDPTGVARTLASMGWLAWRQCHFDEARRLSVESLELHRALNDDGGIAQSLNNLGWVAIFEGQYSDAEGLLAECLAIRRRLGDRRNIAFVLTSLAWASGLMGKMDTADAMLDECLSIFREIGEQQLYAFALRVRSEMLLAADDKIGALDLLQRESVPIFRNIGDRWGLQFALGVEADALLDLGRIVEAEKVISETLDILRTLDNPYCTAITHLRLGVLAAHQSDSGGAVENLTLADRLLADIHGAMTPYHRSVHARTLAAVNGTLTRG